MLSCDSRDSAPGRYPPKITVEAVKQNAVRLLSVDWVYHRQTSIDASDFKLLLFLDRWTSVPGRLRLVPAVTRKSACSPKDSRWAHTEIVIFFLADELEFHIAWL